MAYQHDGDVVFVPDCGDRTQELPPTCIGSYVALAITRLFDVLPSVGGTDPVNKERFERIERVEHQRPVFAGLLIDLAQGAHHTVEGFGALDRVDLDAARKPALKQEEERLGKAGG